MQRLIVDVDDKYINLVVQLLSSLKQNVVKNITIEKKSTKKSISNLKRFRELKAKSNNKTTLTMSMAINTNDMVNDGLL